MALATMLAQGTFEHHVLVGADARGQDLGDVGLGDGREAVVDGAGRRRVLEVVHLAQGQDEGEDAVLVVAQDALVVARLHAAEGHGGARGEADRVDVAEDLGAEGHQPASPSPSRPRLRPAARRRCDRATARR